MNWKEEAFLKIKEKLSRRGTPMVCELCGGTIWDVGDAIAPFVQDFSKPGTLTLGGPNIPMVALVCKMCGNIKFISLVILGVIPGSKNLVENQINEILNKEIK